MGRVGRVGRVGRTQDFGLSRIRGQITSTAGTGGSGRGSSGTLCWMAPELIAGSRPSEASGARLSLRSTSAPRPLRVRSLSALWCLLHVRFMSHMSAPCPRCFRSVPELCPTCVRSMSAICPLCARSMSAPCPPYVRDCRRVRLRDHRLRDPVAPNSIPGTNSVLHSAPHRRSNSTCSDSASRS